MCAPIVALRKISSGAIPAMFLAACGPATSVAPTLEAHATQTLASPTPSTTPLSPIPTRAQVPATVLPPGLYLQYSVAHLNSDESPLIDVVLASVPDMKKLVVLSGVLNGAVSPDGTKALSLQPDGLSLHYLAESGASILPLASGGNLIDPSDCELPNWSPSSNKAAIACQPLLSDSDPAIFLFDANKQHLESLPIALRCFSPHWSPQEEALAADCWDEYSGGITLIPTTGLPYSAFPCPGPLKCNRPAWAPDGSLFSFFAGEGRSGVPTLPFGLHIAPASCIIDTSSCLRSIIGPIAPTEDWDWSPDATRIAYADRGDVWIYDLPTGVPSQISHSLNPITAIKWSPDGQWLALAHFDSITIVSLAGLPTQYVLGETIVLQEWIHVTSSL